MQRDQHADKEFLSTLSLRRATVPTKISLYKLLNFYPRSPCGERQALQAFLSVFSVFLSTLSLRRATAPVVIFRMTLLYFYPRSPCGERRLKPRQTRTDTNFYPRSPCGERQPTSGILCINPLFLSTLSLRRATPSIQVQHLPKSISIHALLAESDHGEITGGYDQSDFYPRSPCGERLLSLLPLQRLSPFLSTLSLRRATPKQPKHQTQTQYFYPRSPCGERQ